MKTKLVSDENYLFLVNIKSNEEGYTYEWGGNEIVAYRKLTSKAHDLVLPELPKQEEDIIQDYIDRHIKDWDEEMHEKYGYEVKQDAERYFEGYKANQNKYTKEDLLKAFLAGIEAIKNLKSDDPSYELEVDYWNSFIKDISPILIPKDFIPEIDWTTPCKDEICKEEENIVKNKGEQYRGIDIYSDGCVWAEPKLKIIDNIIQGIYKF